MLTQILFFTFSVACKGDFMVQEVSIYNYVITNVGEPHSVDSPWDPDIIPIYTVSWVMDGVL